MSKQRLNSLDPFRKQSSRLVLEQYGHCEVPAGCGGVVLRWRNPRAALPVRLHLYTPVEARFFLDGQPLARTAIDLVPGPHLLALSLDEADLSAVLLLAALLLAPGSRVDSAASPDPGVRVLSAADGTWKYTLVAPPEDWAALSFDASAWPALSTRPMAELSWEATGAYQQRTCLREKAAPLILPPVAKRSPGRGPVWIRKVFTLPVPA